MRKIYDIAVIGEPTAEKSTWIAGKELTLIKKE